MAGESAIGLLGSLGTMFNNIGQNSMAMDRTRDQNAYNSPVEQMARYQAAGLNPNLIYGQGNPGNQGSPTPTRGVSDGVDFQGALAGAVAMQNAKKQGLLLDSQKNEVDQRAHGEWINNLRNLPWIHNNWQSDWMGNPIPGVKQGSPAERMVAYQESQKEAAAAVGMQKVATQKMINELLTRDRSIKDLKIGEFRHYNALRDVGIEKHDSLPWRAGVTGVQTAYKWLSQKFGFKGFGLPTSTQP